MTAAQVQMIALEELEANPLNPRKTFDESALAELAQSIRSIGITQPLLVRPALDLPEAGELARYEIVAGHRRAEAATLAGLTEVPCIVRELTDAEAADIALIDNVQRVDVSALEEAEAFGELLARHGSIEAVAAKVGKEVSHVAKRLRLRALTLWSCDALREKLITVDHALLLARLGVDQQDQALKWLLDPQAGVKATIEKVLNDRLERVRQDSSDERHMHWRKWECESPQRLKEHIEQSSGRKLARAPWDLDDADLVLEAGACAHCPLNTKANTALFSDLNIEEATCADGACFDAKREAFVKIQLRAVKTGPGSYTGMKVPRLSWKFSSVKPATCANDLVRKGSLTLTANPEKVLLQGQWVAAKKGSCPDTRTGVTVDWERDQARGSMGGGKDRKPGEALTVCIAVDCTVHPKKYEEPKSENTYSRQTRRDPAAEKAAEEKRAALAIEESKLRMAVASKALEAITALPGEALRMLAIHAAPEYGDALKIANALLPGFEKILTTAKVSSLEFAKAAAIASLEELDVSEWNGPKYGREKFLASAKRIGYTGPDPWKEPAETKAAPKKIAAKPAAKKSAKPANKAGKKAGKAGGS
jgi:ParB/RepB/Spo0J family partition protein